VPAPVKSVRRLELSGSRARDELTGEEEQKGTDRSILGWPERSLVPTAVDGKGRGLIAPALLERCG
jgi:hypothetical protein